MPGRYLIVVHSRFISPGLTRGRPSRKRDKTGPPLPEGGGYPGPGEASEPRTPLPARQRGPVTALLLLTVCRCKECTQGSTAGRTTRARVQPPLHHPGYTTRDGTTRVGNTRDGTTRVGNTRDGQPGPDQHPRRRTTRARSTPAERITQASLNPRENNPGFL